MKKLAIEVFMEDKRKEIKGRREEERERVKGKGRRDKRGKQKGR